MIGRCKRLMQFICRIFENFWPAIAFALLSMVAREASQNALSPDEQPSHAKCVPVPTTTVVVVVVVVCWKTNQSC